jgi:hypothetical protein
MLLATKLRNEIRKVTPELEFHLKNVSVNGSKRGCRGFIVNPSNGLIAYVDTEHLLNPHVSGALYRTAKNLKDYYGGRNLYAPADQLAKAIVKMLS